MTISSRLAKLEDQARSAGGAALTKEERDAQFARLEQEALRVAAVVNGAIEVSAYLNSMMEVDDEKVIDLDQRQRQGSVRGALSRILFDKARAGGAHHPNSE